MHGYPTHTNQVPSAPGFGYYFFVLFFLRRLSAVGVAFLRDTFRFVFFAGGFDVAW
ncbi:hypothetical protein LCGC14_2712360, partial [marine sediment metagenome]